MTKTDTPLMSPGDLDLERRVDAFEQARRIDPAADLRQFLPPVNHVGYRRVLRELICVDLELAWDRGERLHVEDYRGRFPHFFDDPDAVREAEREEARLRRTAGEASLARTQAVDVVAATDTAETVIECRLPAVNDVIAGFRLQGVLGTGAFGTVFLAKETGLAGRLVALKVSRRFPGEAQTLARLQHSNIVPVYSLHQHGPWHLIAMPWLGGTTFADLLHSIRGAGSLPATGRSLLSTLHDKAQRTIVEPASAPPAPVQVLPTIRLLEQSTFVDAVLQFGEQLAEALAHAHSRGVLHRDLKPANILLADDGRPMLLDFNLAADDELATTDAAGIGGTLRYMAPEAIVALTQGRGHADARADVYALGLILYELLGAALPFPDVKLDPKRVGDYLATRLAAPDPLTKHRPDCPPGLAAILAKCLAPDAADRYASAADLAEDFRRQRQHLPLKYVANPSLREQVAKWARRHPRLSSATTLGVLAAAILTTVVLVFLSRQHHLSRLEAQQAWATLRSERDDLRLMLTSPDVSRRGLEDVRRRARQLLPDDGVTLPGVYEPLNESDRESVRRDLGAVQAEAAAAAGALAKREPDAARRTSLLQEADVAFRDAKILRPTHADGIDGLSAELHRKDYRAALRTLDAAGRDVSPAAWFARGVAQYHLQEYLEAVRALDVALVLAPRQPAILFQRGLALLALGRAAEAAADFTAVLDADAADDDARLNRALCRLEIQDAAAAIQDLDQLEKSPHAPTRLYFLRERAKRLAGDNSGADADHARGLAATPTDAVSWVARGRARMTASPKDALSDFEAAVALDSDLQSGWENIAEVLSEKLNRPADALAAQDRVVAMDPQTARHRAGRAVLHARLKHKAEAMADADAAARLKPDALANYQIACARILVSDTDADRTASLMRLRDVLRQNPAWAADMETDADLKSVHGSTEFRRLIAAAKQLAGP